MKRPSWRFGPVATFAIVGLLALAVLGIAASVLGRDLVQDRAQSQTEREARAAASVGVEPLIRPSDLADDAPAIDDDRRARLDAALLGTPSDGDVLLVRVWSRDLRVVYGNDRSEGAGVAASETLQDSLDGEVTSETVRARRSTGETVSAIAVYLPLRSAGGRFTSADDAPVVGSLEVELPRGPVADAVNRDTRRLNLFVGVGLLAVYVLLLGLVVSSSRRLKAQVLTNRHQARHDGLTGLPNRVVLRERLVAALSTDDPVALALLDLDGFKEVNDTLGHRHGDAVLVEVAGRLEATVDRQATVVRLGGDEFAILLPGESGEGDATAAAQSLLTGLQEVVEVAGLSVEVRASVGVVLAPVHGTTPDELLAQAEVAMDQAKADRSPIAPYDPERDVDSPRRVALASQVRRAIDQSELVVHFQPKLDLARQEVVGVEALVRWLHPVEGLLLPGEFMPVVESTSLIRPLTAFVVEVTLAQCRTWRDEGMDLEVSVNLSAGSVHDAELPGQLVAALERHGLPPESLVLELTETTLLANPARARTVLEELHDLGVRMSIDDFGTGYASLAYLRDLPVDELKIDRSFIGKLAQQGQDAAIVEYSIGLARTLGLRVVAEGVEDVEVIDCLIALGCDQAQGYHVARPGPPEGIGAIVRSFAVTEPTPPPAPV